MDFSFRRFIGETARMPHDGKQGSLALSAYRAYAEAADTYEILCADVIVGTLEAAQNTLGGFCVADEFYAFAPEILRAAMDTFGLDRAVTLTADSRLVSLCLGFGANVKSVGRCFTRVRAVPERERIAVRCADMGDFDKLAKFGFAEEHKLENLLKAHSVYMCGDLAFAAAQTVAGVPVALLSAYVTPHSRFRGLGSALLARLGSLCADYHLAPFAFCAENDTACMRALESAGFACIERIVEIPLCTVKR